MCSLIVIKIFDVEFSWMSKYCNFEQVYFYFVDMDEERLQMVRVVRGGGSILLRYYKKLKDYIFCGRLELWMEIKLVNVQFVIIEVGGWWKVEIELVVEGILLFDFIYFVMGIEIDVVVLLYLQMMREMYFIDEMGGLLCLIE